MSFHSPVFTLSCFQIPQGRIHCNYFSIWAKVSNFMYNRLSYRICQLKVPHHGPLIMFKRGWVDRSIEGDASIRVGGYQRHVSGCISFDHTLECRQNTLKGHYIQSSFGVMSLRLLYNHFYVTYVMPFYVTYVMPFTWLRSCLLYLWCRITSVYKPMISHQLYVDRFSNVFSGN